MEKIYSTREESLNVWSHGLGTLAAVAGTLFLLVKTLQLHDPKVFLAYLIYGFGVTIMFLASTLYHSAKDPVKRKKLNILDHVSIFLTIAGSYTPISWLLLPSSWGIPVLIAVWTIALGGIILKFFFIGRYSLLSTLLYVLMGWVIVVAIKPLVQFMSVPGLIWLLAGGIAYSIGALLYQVKKLPYNHAIFHLFVLIGAACHFIVMWKYCVTFN